MGRPKKQKTEKSTGDGKAVFQVRLDSDIHEKLKSAAATAGISMNQLIQGVLRWGAEHVRQGRPTLNGEVIGEEPYGQCVWFGHVTKPLGVGQRGHKGMFVFTLDYSDKKALSTELFELEEIDGKFVLGDDEIRDGDTEKNFQARLQAFEAERAATAAVEHKAK